MQEGNSYKNLQGKSFKGQDLTGASFEHTDIRGADFTNAVLIGANFSGSKTGRQFYRIIFLSIITLLLLALAGFISSYASALIVGLLFLGNKVEFLLSSFLSLIGLSIFIFITIHKGLGASLGAFSLIIAAAIAMVAAIGNNKDAVGAIVVQSVGISSAIAGVLAGATGLVLFRSTAKRLVTLAATILLLSTIPGTLVGIGSLSRDSRVVALAFTEIIAVVLISFSTYISWRTVRGDKKFFLISSVITILTSLGGTSFRGANLTDADFTGATLKSADFRKANLNRTNWYSSTQLEQSRYDSTYLADSQIRQLVITKDGRGKHFEHCNLRGLNLKGADLKDAFLIGTDLSEATLENTNLTGAKLVRAQLYQANLAGACLTGTYIENWGISTDTNFDNVKCDYIYMQLPTDADPDPCRKPDNKKENFKEGDFADFITPIIRTLDLYQTQNVDLREVASKFKTLDLFHYEGIDPSAAAVALNQLAEEYPEAELEVISLEGRGNEKIRLQAKVTGDTNRSKLYTEYFAKYSQIKLLPYGDMQALLSGIEEKDERIHSLEKLLENAISQPKFYVETYQNQGEFIMSQSKGNVNISGVQGDVSGVAAAGENQTMTGVAIGAISGTVTNTINQLPASPDPDSPGIKELLAQLQAAIESESELPDEDKAEALEQVKTLAEAGQKPEDNVLQKAAKTSMKILKGTVASLPDAAKLAESCVKLLPAIATLLAFV